MRELNNNEINEVSGGIFITLGLVGAVAGALLTTAVVLGGSALITYIQSLLTDSSSDTDTSSLVESAANSSS
ncbi:hypothetical protein ABW286_10655 [Erwinia papayae]|uniref:Class IIb bacteriocin, lactobin A/cerein 7B family n=1 Tax=Erwinia papayae TaxID=206499 RepID=A0ABV3N1E7_9GAMM